MEDKRNKVAREDTEQRHLPDYLIIRDILPRLPIKPLTQYKVVSKKWYSSISSPNFILTHTKQPLNFHPSYPIESLFIQSGNSFYLYSCDNIDDNNVGIEFALSQEFACTCECNSGNNLVKLNVEFEVGNGEEIELVGCCNGLVCLAETNGKYFFLFNPATKQSHKFYTQDFESLDKPHTVWGFGYESSNNDFKVVRFLFDRNVGQTTVHVYSLRANMWRKVEFGLEGGYLRGRGLLVDETLYWTMICILSNRITIVGFDLGREIFETFPHLAMNSARRDVLCVMGGCLSKCSSNTQTNELIFETVKQPAGELVSTRLPCDFIINYHYELIGFTKTNKVFVAHTERPLLDLIDHHSQRTLVMFDYHRTLIDKYVPSQIPPLPSAKFPNAPN